MADYKKLRQHRANLRTLQTSVHGLRQQLQKARASIDQANRVGDAAAAGVASNVLATLTSQLENLSSEIIAVSATIERLRSDNVSPLERIDQLDGNVPIALLPVRLETHFQREADGVTALNIRIYPDDIHIDSHEAELTEAEILDAKHYWVQFWRAGPDVQRQAIAWQLLAERYGAHRAAWIAERTQPVNSAPQIDQPLSDDTPLPFEPDFPQVDAKESDWTRPAVAKLLPDHWIATGFRDGERLFRVVGATIPENLSVSPDPNSEFDPSTSQFVDDGNRWTIDFEEAVSNGMGIRIPASSIPNPDAGLDLLLVVGVKSSSDPEEGADALTEMFTSHRYTEGLGFLRRGTPTNNTEHARSAWQDRVLPRPGEKQPEKSSLSPGDGSVAGTWAWALGLDDGQTQRAFGDVPGAKTNEDQNARAMQAAIWPATWGYILQHLGGINAIKLIKPLRPFVLKWLRPGGHFASIRVGNQPYGLIVHTDIDSVDPGAGSTLGQLIDLLRGLRDKFWLPAVNRSPHIGRTSDPDQDLVEILGHQAASSAFAIRPALGPALIANLRSLFESAGDSQWWSNHQINATSALSALNLQLTTKITDFGFFKRPSAEIPTLVQEDSVEPGEGINPNYIKWLANSGYKEIWNEKFPGSPPKTLLYRILRQSTLQETASSAVGLIQEKFPDLGEVTMERELNRLGDDDSLDDGFGPESPIPPANRTLAGVLDLPISGVTDGRALGDFLTGKRNTDDPSLPAFKEFWDAMRQLEDVSVEQLELLLRETLDCSSHRLDAWLSAFSTSTLGTQRDPGNSNSGVHIGGFGWVEDLRPRTEKRSDGFIHTPSLQHASLAAVLRSGYLSHFQSPDSDSDAFAIDLSSQRVRLASWILDGVRTGQSLGALLGYRFERALHEQHPGVELDVYIYTFRRIAPLIAGKLQPIDESESLESVAANNVVDGLALLRAWENNQLDFTFDDELPDPGTAEHTAILKELEGLQAVVDAVGDALLAESLFQPDNPSRTAATLDAVASGEVPPPDLTFARTPVHGIGLTQRIIIALPADPPASQWTQASASARAALDPSLDAWVGSILGTPTQYLYRVRYRDPTNGLLLHEEARSLTDLALSPLDVVYLADGDLFTDSSELGGFALHDALHQRPSGVSLESSVEISALDGDDAQPLHHLFELARAIRELLKRARVLDARQFLGTGESGSGNVDLTDLEGRVNQIISRFSALDNALVEILDHPDSAPLNTLNEILVGLQYFGLRNATPRSQNRALLVRQAQLLVNPVSARRQKLKGVDTELGVPEPDEDARVKLARARAAAILATEACLLPQFMTTNSGELQQSMHDQASLLGGELGAPVTWLQRMARVRERIADFNDVLIYDGAINNHDPYALKILQLPFQAGEKWIGLPHDTDQPHQANRLSVAMFDPFDVDPANAMTGFVVDEWPETIPAETQTTAISFQFDQPGARAPNTLLLAVSPQKRASWDIEQLEKITLDTLELAKIRCVDGDSLRGLGQFLPALFFASNRGGDTIDPRFEMLFPSTTLSGGS